MREQARRPSGNHPDTSGKVPKPARPIGNYKLENMPSAQIYTLFKEIVWSLGICTKYNVQCTKSWDISLFFDQDFNELTNISVLTKLTSRQEIPFFPIFKYICNPNCKIDFRLDYISTIFLFYIDHIPNRYCFRDLRFAPISTLFLPYFHPISFNLKQSCLKNNQFNL